VASLQYHISLYFCWVSHELVLETLTGGGGGGDRRCQKRQTKEQTCIKLGHVGLCDQMETHQHSPPPVHLLYTVATWGRAAFLGGGGVTPWSLGTGGTCDRFSPNGNIKGKNSCTSSCPLLQLRLCQSSVQFYWT
jgi:hypothetical protein